MTSQAAAVEQPRLASDERRRPVFSGAWLLSGAMVLSGVLTYAFHVIAARSLGPHAYGQIGILWGAMFIVAIVAFRPLEQTTSRAVADRLARGEEVRTVLRSVGAICAALLVVGVIAMAFAWGSITRRLFLGNDVMTAMLFAGIAAYGLQYLVRGLLGGVRWFPGYGLGLTADALTRLAVAAPLVVLASQNLAAAAVAAAGLGGALVPVLLGGRRLRSISSGHAAGAHFRISAALTFAAPASVIAAADQLLVNGGPLLVIAGASSDASKTAGVVFAATMLVRAPVWVFQGLAAALLPNLTHLHATDDLGRFRRAVLQTAGCLLGCGALVVLLAGTAGPPAMKLLYGPGFEAGAIELALLGAGVGFYLAAATFSQALLALARGVRASAGWAVAAVLFISLYFVLPGEPLMRVSLALALATLAGLALLAHPFVRKPSQR